MPAARVLSGMRTGVRENDREERSGGNGGLNSVSTSTSETSKVTNDEGHNGRVREQDLDRWKEDDEDDGFEVPAVNVVGSSRVMGEGDSEGLLKRERAKRAGIAVTSESWDDDFLFQHDPTPPTSPARLRSRTPSRSSRPVSPLPRQPNLLPPSRPTSQHSSPTVPPRHQGTLPASPSARNGDLSVINNPSLDSLVSSLDWSIASDHEPTLTIHSNSNACTPPTPVSPPDYHRSQQPNLSTSTARPTTASSQQTLSPPSSHLPKRPSPRPVSYNSSSRTPSSATTYRSETPSLTADSLRSLTSETPGDELKTETEDDETEDERRTSSMSNRPSIFGLKRWSQEIISSPPTSPTLKPTNSKRWRFGRTKKEPLESKENGQNGGIFGRRTGPREPEQVSIIDQTENKHYLRRSGLPLPVRDGQFVVLGRRGRTGAGGSASRSSVEAVDGVPVRPAPPPRAKHSSGTSISTTSTTSSGNTRSRPQRNSLHFLPMSLQNPSSPVPQSPHLPPHSHSWQEYDGTTDDREEETTEAEMSEFSGDERFHLPTSHSRLDSRRRSPVTNTPSTSYSSTSPTSPSDSARPNSPVESILGDRIGRWNTSQVSFVSASSAFGLHQSQPSITETVSTGYDTTRPDDTMKNRKRKLVKRRPGSEDTTFRTQPSLSIADGAIQQPLPSGVSSRSSASSKPLPSTTSLQLPPSHGHRQSPSLPFAQESDAEAAQRPKFARRRSSTTPGKIPSTERGQVVDIDSDWLGIVPFPPSPRSSLDARNSPSIPPLPLTPSAASKCLSSSNARKVPGTVKSHPPVTGRTQAETKTKRSSGGIGQSISNMLSRSTSALPLGGSKRAPSPAPSAKSGKSNRSLLMRSGSKKVKKDEVNPETAPSTLPKSPSLSLLKKRSSAIISPPRDTPPSLPSAKRQSSSSSKAAPSPSKTPHRPNPSTEKPRPNPPITSSPSFFDRARGLSRSTNAKEWTSATPPSPVKHNFSTSRMSPPPVPSRSSTSRAPNPRARPTNLQSPTKGQLNTTFKMPRPESTLSSISTGTCNLTASAAMRDERPPSSLKIKGQRSSPQTRSGQAGHRPSLSLSSIMRSPSPSPRSLPPPLPPATSTTPIDLSPPRTPYERPRTALGTDRPPTSYYFDEDLLNEEDFILPRRNSLSDLRIPARITNAQKKIEEDLERVKQFAKGIEDLKALRRQYEQLVEIFVEPPSLDHSTPRRSMDLSAVPVNSKVSQGIRRVEIDYSQWWEQAKTLIDLGDGKPQQAQRTSPGTLASRRDRCVSMAPESSPSKSSQRLSAVSGSETETEETYSLVLNSMSSRPGGLLRSLTEGGKETRPGIPRMPSASSIETEASVGARQREMLRGVLAPALKGASLPSRGPPSPRPGLAVLAQVDTNLEDPPRTPPLTSPTKRPPFSLQYPSSSTSIRQKPNNNRRVSRVGVSGIREFLLRLRTRATQELANSVGSLPPSSDSTPAPSSIISAPPRRSVSDPSTRPATPSHSRRPTPSSLLQHVAASASESSSRHRSHSTSSEEDWDADMSPPRNSLIEIDHPSSSSSLRRGRTVSAGRPSTPGTARKEMMILTTDNMPQLLDKVKEVQERCENCIDILKGLTL